MCWEWEKSNLFITCGGHLCKIIIHIKKSHNVDDEILSYIILIKKKLNHIVNVLIIIGGGIRISLSGSKYKKSKHIKILKCVPCLHILTKI